MLSFNFFVVDFNGKGRRESGFDSQVCEKQTVPCTRGHGGFVGARSTGDNPYFVGGTSVNNVCCHQKMAIGRWVERTTQDGNSFAWRGWRGWRGGGRGSGGVLQPLPLMKVPKVGANCGCGCGCGCCAQDNEAGVLRRHSSVLYSV